MRRPRVDPDVAGRAVEHAVRAAAGAREVEDQLQQDRAAGARAHLARPRRHQRAREALGEELRNAVERLSASTKRHQLCSSHWPSRRSSQLVSSVSSRSRNQTRCPAAARRAPVAASSTKRATIAKSSSDSGRCAAVSSSLLAVALREQDALGADEVAVDPDPPHRVRHVAVEAGEEAEAVLGRQVAAPVDARAGHRAGCAPCRRAGRASRRPSPRSRARPARARRSSPPRRRRGPRPAQSSLRQPNP